MYYNDTLQMVKYIYRNMMQQIAGSVHITHNRNASVYSLGLIFSFFIGRIVLVKY